MLLCLTGRQFIISPCVAGYSCFFSLLLVAFIVWKLKQRYDIYRRGQVRFALVTVTATIIILFYLSFVAGSRTAWHGDHVTIIVLLCCK